MNPLDSATTGKAKDEAVYRLAGAVEAVLLMHDTGLFTLPPDAERPLRERATRLDEATKAHDEALAAPLSGRNQTKETA